MAYKRRLQCRRCQQDAEYRVWGWAARGDGDYGIYCEYHANAKVAELKRGKCLTMAKLTASGDPGRSISRLTEAMDGNRPGGGE